MHIDSLKTAKDTAQFILESIYEINKNTDGFSTGLSTAISVVSIIASVAKLAGALRYGWLHGADIRSRRLEPEV